jgi:hypothetical protein
MRTQNLQRRVEALEVRQSSIPDCDPSRRLAKYASYFEGRPWECTGTPERKAQRDANLTRYRKYFEDLEASDEVRS